MSRQWCTKEDVLKDLELVSGCRLADVDDGYFVYGSQPPPRTFDNEGTSWKENNRLTMEFRNNRHSDVLFLTDFQKGGGSMFVYEEMELRFGTASERRGSGDLPGPDLNGITQLLRSVEKYQNSPEEEPPISPNKMVVISKARVSQKPSTSKTGSSKEIKSPGKDRDNLMSPNKRHLRDNFNKSPASGKVVKANGELNSHKNESGDKIVSNSSTLSKSDEKSVFNCSTEKEILNNGLSPYKTNNETSLPYGNIASKEVTPVKVVTNNGTLFSMLNPYVKEFVPKNAQIENIPKTAKIPVDNVINTQSMDNITSSNKTLGKEMDDSKLTDESPAVGNNKDSKKSKIQMLKSQISTKNDTFKDRDQTNRAIVNLLKLYAAPKAAKPLKLLTPQFFEQSTKLNDDTKEPNEIDRSIERMASLHDVNEPNVDVNSKKSLSSIEESQEPTSVAFGRPKNSDMPTNANIDLENKIDHLEKDICDKNLKSNACNNIYDENDEDFNENNNYDKGNDADKLEKNKYRAILKENDDIEDFNNETSLTPDVEDIYIKESINKVTNWLRDKPVVPLPEKPKSPVVYLGAMAYKRKDPATCKSPSEVVDKKVPKASQTTSQQQEFKPSKYAVELHKKYSERSKNDTPSPTLNIWEKLEADLKKKDLEIKNKRDKKSS